MSGLQVAMIPEGKYSQTELGTLITELERFYKGKEVMHTKEAAAFLGIGVTTLYRIPKTSLPYHKIEGLEGRLYLRSELLHSIRNS